MRKDIFAILFLITGLFLTCSSAANAQDQGTVGVFDKDSFVVVNDRGNDDSSVLLYKVVKGRLKLVHALLVDGDFSDVSRPSVRVTPARIKSD
jgi:hypothetical protein